MKRVILIVKYLCLKCLVICVIISITNSCNPPKIKDYSPIIIDTAYTDFVTSNSTYGTYRADYKIYYIGEPIDTIIIDHLLNGQLNPFQGPHFKKKQFHRFVINESTFSLNKNNSEIKIYVDTTQRIKELYMNPNNPKLLEYYPVIISNLSDSNYLYFPMYTGYGIGLQVAKNNKLFFPEMGGGCGTHSHSIILPPGMIMITGVKKYKDSVKTKARIIIKNVESNEFELGIHEYFLKE